MHVHSVEQAAGVYRAARFADAEARGKAFYAEEEERSFHIGCPDYAARPALILTIEAARHICGPPDGDNDYSCARTLLRAALAALDKA
jgi:hypothetical protein